jgi:hypothetical protein
MRDIEQQLTIREHLTPAEVERLIEAARPTTPASFDTSAVAGARLRRQPDAHFTLPT